MAKSAGIVWTRDTLTPGLKEFTPKVDSMISKSVDYFDMRTEAYARSNAPWTDRTGNARNGLRTEPFHEPMKRHGIVLSHSVPYGIWLEVRWEGRYAIIVPTITHEGQELMQFIKGLLGKMGVRV